MSILIKGMEMPHVGDHLLLLHVYHDGTASVIGDRYYKNEPFEVVPVASHGRLVDMDTLKAKVEWLLDEKEAKYFNEFWLSDMPTIIPAEEG